MYYNATFVGELQLKTC